MIAIAAPDFPRMTSQEYLVWEQLLVDYLTHFANYPST